MYLTINTQSHQFLHFFENPNLGEAIERHKAEQIEKPDVAALKEWQVTLEKDESGQPIIPPEFELPIKTYDTNGYPDLEKQIQEYIDQNGRYSVQDLILNESDFTVSENETAKVDRENAEALAILRINRKIRIEEVEWMFRRHDDEVELEILPSLTEAEVKELRQYVQDLRDLPANTSDFTGPVWPDKPKFCP